MSESKINEVLRKLNFLIEKSTAMQTSIDNFNERISVVENKITNLESEVEEFKQTVTAPICFICPTKFSNSALLFGSYFCCVSLRVIVFFNFRTFRSTPNFRHNAQLFCFFAEF